MSPRVVLIGAPGAGKTTVGELLAAQWQEGFRDTDRDVEEFAGKAVADIFIEDGEDVFRAFEGDAVARALAEHDGVLALGGGAVLAEPTRELLRGHSVVWLRVGLADAVNRVGLSGARPLLVGNVRGQLHAMLQERAPLYQKVAHVIVDTDGRTPEDVVAAVVAGLEVGT
jgi:shikimate kinase